MNMRDPRGLFLGTFGGRPLFHSGKSHLLTVAPPRSGKSTSVVTNNLLHCQGSVFATDPKGELAAMTAEHRRKRFGQKVMILNPWGLHGLPQHRYNPLQPLIETAGDPLRERGAIDIARSNSMQFLPDRQSGGNSRYFENGSRRMLFALQLHLATWGNRHG